jgi:hypothetical protein
MVTLRHASFRELPAFCWPLRTQFAVVLVDRVCYFASGSKVPRSQLVSSLFAFGSAFDWQARANVFTNHDGQTLPYCRLDVWQSKVEYDEPLSRRTSRRLYYRCRLEGLLSTVMHAALYISDLISLASVHARRDTWASTAYHAVTTYLVLGSAINSCGRTGGTMMIFKDLVDHILLTASSSLYRDEEMMTIFRCSQSPL